MAKGWWEWEGGEQGFEWTSEWSLVIDQIICPLPSYKNYIK